MTTKILRVRETVRSSDVFLFNNLVLLHVFSVVWNKQITSYHPRSVTWLSFRSYRISNTRYCSKKNVWWSER